MGTYNGQILDLFEGETDTNLTDFIQEIAEEDRGEERRFLDELFANHRQEGHPDSRFATLMVAYIRAGFDSGFVFGRRFDSLGKKAAAAVTRLEKRLIEENLLRHGARKGCEKDGRGREVNLLGEALQIAAISKTGSAFAFEKTGGPGHESGDFSTLVQLFDAIHEKAEKFLDAEELQREEPQPNTGK